MVEYRNGGDHDERMVGEEREEEKGGKEAMANGTDHILLPSPVPFFSFCL
jgi:hypothetical protein